MHDTITATGKVGGNGRVSSRVGKDGGSKVLMLFQMPEVLIYTKYIKSRKYVVVLSNFLKLS